MTIELEPKEVDLLCRLTENPEVEIDDETLKKFIIASQEGFTFQATLSLEHPITVRRISNIDVSMIIKGEKE